MGNFAMTYVTDVSPEVTPDYLEIIETVIGSLDSNDSAMVSNNDGRHVWKFQYGSVEVFVQVDGASDDAMFTVWSPVLKLPAKNEAALMLKLMSLNWIETYESRFAVVDGQVVVCSRRALSDLSPSEVSRNITIVAAIADEYDDVLTSEYAQS